MDPNTSHNSTPSPWTVPQPPHSHLVFAGPEGADGELHLVPLASLGARDVPHGAALGAPVDPDVDLQVPGAVAVAAVQEEAELDAVGVVLAEGQQQQLSSLAPEMLRGIDHHEGPWRGKTHDKRTPIKCCQILVAVSQTRLAEGT